MDPVAPPADDGVRVRDVPAAGARRDEDGPGPWFFKSFSGGWNFTPADEAVGRPRTEATWRYNFTIRPAWLAPSADRIGAWLLGRDIRRRLDAFAAACADPEILAAVPTSHPPAA